jgi:hypothetical protein
VGAWRDPSGRKLIVRGVGPRVALLDVSVLLSGGIGHLNAYEVVGVLVMLDPVPLFRLRVMPRFASLIMRRRWSIQAIVANPVCLR